MKKLVAKLLPKSFQRIIKKFINNTEDWVLYYLEIWLYQKREIRRAHHNYIYYPNDKTGKKWFSRIMFGSGDDSSGYVAQYYKKRWNLLHKDHFEDYPMAEILFAKKYKGEATINISEPALLPIAIKSKNGNPDKLGDSFYNSINGKEIQMTELFEESYYYLNIPASSKVKLRIKEREFFVGKPIKKKRNQNLKLVLPIFVDGLGSEFFKHEPFKKLMPRTHAFFSKGTIFQNCHSIGEWTLPNVASICTGRYTQHHGIFHPQSGDTLDNRYRLISEYFQEENYFTSQIGGNWRKTPAHGYARGYDRTLFQREMDVREVITEFLDQLEGFPENSHFTWLTLFDLHHRFYGAPTIDVQPKHDLEWYYSDPSTEKSVRKEFDQNAIHRNILEIKNIDRYLGYVYDYIEKTFKDEDILVVFFSDHGQSYLSEDSHVLSDKRINVPLMFRGRGVQKQKSDELVQNIDILPALHHLADLKTPFEKMDGQLPKTFGGENEREFTFAESIFPRQTYKSVFKNKDEKFVFESSDLVNDSGMFNLESIQCIERPVTGTLSGEDETHYRMALDGYLKTSCFRK